MGTIGQSQHQEYLNALQLLIVQLLTARVVVSVPSHRFAKLIAFENVVHEGSDIAICLLCANCASSLVF